MAHGDMTEIRRHLFAHPIPETPGQAEGRLLDRIQVWARAVRSLEPILLANPPWSPNPAPLPMRGQAWPGARSGSGDPEQIIEMNDLLVQCYVLIPLVDRASVMPFRSDLKRVQTRNSAVTRLRPQQRRRVFHA